MELCAGIFGRDLLNKRAGSSSPKILSGSGQSTRRLITDRIDLQPACYRQFYLCQINSQITNYYLITNYAAAVGRLRLHRRPASVAAEWCLRLHGWPIMPPLLGVYDFTAGLPPSPPSGASAYTAGLLCRRCWASTTSPPACLRRRRVVPPPTRLASYAAAVGRLRLHRRPASVAAEWCLRLHGWPVMPPLLGVYDFTAGVAAEWCLRLHGWPIMPPLLGVYDFTAGLPPSPPSGASAYTAGLLCRRCWASTTSPPACLRRRRVVPPPTRLAYYAAAVGRLRLHRRPASVAAEWCLRLHGWPVMPPLLGVYDFTAGPPPSPPSGASAYTAGLLCRRCWASTTSPPARLRRRRVVPPPTRLAYYAAAVGRLRLHRRPASVAAEWIQIQICIKGIHGFKLISYAPGMDQSEHYHRLASTVADWCFRLHGWPLCRRCWASTSSPTGRLVRRRLVLPPARLAFMPPLLGVYVFTDRLAFAAADWCFRLYGWPLCRHCWAFTSSPTGLPSPPPTGVSACTAGLLCRRCWASTSSPTGRLVRRRLVLPPARLTYFAAVVGRLRLHRPAASSAADWCFRLHGWPLCRRCWASMSSPTGRLVRRRLVFPPARLAFMPPLLGVYVFTDRPPRPPPTGVSACTAGLFCCRCWASTSSPTGRLVRRRLVFPPARLAFMPPLLGVYVFTDRPPRPPPTGVSACTASLLCCRCWASTSSPTGRLVRRRLVFPPARLAYYAAVVGRLRLHRPAAASAADWCHRLHGWPVIAPTHAIFFTAGYIAVTTNRHQYLQHKLPTFAMAADWFLHFHGCMILPLLMDIIVFRRRLVMPPPTGAFIFTTARLHYRFTSSRQHNFVIMVERLHLYYLRISTWTSSTHIFNQAITIRRQEAIVLDSMFSCFPTNQRVGGYTNTRLKI
uniref:cysteine dioxygenase n=1 Tax=Oryza sativa subsp. japonica TaxID=39947 RepID=Q7XKH4_ORYSJ|nr:OSJNBb0033P05.13 [Oryza sativa Japonica Group]